MRNLFFLKGSKVYQIDISSKKLEEPEFTRGKDIIFISGNINNEYLIIVMKNGSIYALNGKNQIKYIKSFLVNSLFLDSNNKKDKKNFNMSKFKLFASQEMDKIVIANEYFMGIWSQNEINPLQNSNNATNNGNRNNANMKQEAERNYKKVINEKINNFSNPNIEELNGTFYNISLESEKRVLLVNESKNNQTNLKRSNANSSNTVINSNNLTQSGNLNKVIENLTCSFSSNYYLGSFGRILYVVLIPTEYQNTYKIHFIDYLFRYEPSFKLKQNCFLEGNNKNEGTVNNNGTSSNGGTAISFTESIRQIEKKIIFSYINFKIDSSMESKLDFGGIEKEYIIMRYNKLANTCAIVVNCFNPHYSSLILFMNETFKTSVYKLYEITTKFRLPLLKENEKSILWIEDIEWICNDTLIILLFSQGYFCILNTNFQCLSLVDTSNCLINEGAIQRFSCPINLHNLKLKFADRLNLLSSKKRSDYFIIYSNTYTICFQANSKAFESKILSQNNRIENFDDFLYLMKFYQIHYSDPESQKNIFENIHLFVYNMHKDLYNVDQEHRVPNENLQNIFRVFIRFIRIFRNTNLIHETNLTILNYLLQISNDFFYILINNKEIWLAFLYINICENYLLKNLKIKIPKNKISDDQLLKGQASYVLLNPYSLQNPSLKNVSKLRNKILHSRLRLILIFLALIEFRNNQALNINVLYFVLGKNCIDKLKKNNMLDDIQMIVKAIIRNYKYLKNENSRAGGEEYILNGLSMNYRSEILSNLIHSRISREDIKFDFFNDFFPLEDMQNYHEINNYYFRGDEEILINEYNYMNNLGIIQKWLLLFSNFCYFFLFEEIKIYMDNHLRQYLHPKLAENISPEETSLSNLIFFNFLFLQLCLNNTIKFFLNFITQKQNYKSDSSFIPDDPNLIEDYSKVFLPTLSPVDIPFLIYEFYVLEDNKNKKNLPNEINNTLHEKIIHHLKPYNFTINDAIDFLEFLVSNNFTCESMSRETNKQQRFMFAGFIYYFLNINKLSQLQAFENDRDFIIKILDSLDPLLKKEAYDLIYIVLNGYLRFYLNMEIQSHLDANSSKHMEFILTFLKTVFYKLVREEPLRLRYNISEYISISPSIMKPYLLEGGLFYEYKTFNKIYKNVIFSVHSIINVKKFTKVADYLEQKCSNNVNYSKDSNFNLNNLSQDNAESSNNKHNVKNKTQINKSNNPVNSLGKNFTLARNIAPRNSAFERTPEPNSINRDQNVNFNDNKNFLFELFEIGDENNDYTNMHNNWFLENIFDTEQLNGFLKSCIKGNSDSNLIERKLFELKESKVDFIKSLKNFIHLIKNNDNKEAQNYSNIIYQIESNKELNKKIIINFIKEIKKENINEEMNSNENNPDLLSMCLDKIILGNFDEKMSFKFSNNDIKKKIIKSIKLSIVKYSHILNILQIKYFTFKNFHPKKDLLNYLKNLSLLLIFDKNDSESIKNSLFIIDAILNLNWQENKTEKESKIIFEIIKHIAILMVKYKKNLQSYSKIKILEEYISVKNIELAKQIKLFLNDDILKIKFVYDNLENFRSENLKLFFISLFIDSYFDNIKILQENLSFYIQKAIDSNQQLVPLNEARKFYSQITEAYQNLNGIPQKSYIYFVENWDLVNSDILHNMIVSDNFDNKTFAIESKQSNNNNQSKKNSNNLDNKYNFIMNRRQKYGTDTPRKRRNSLKLNKKHIKIPNCSNKNIHRVGNSNSNKINLNKSNEDYDMNKKRSSSVQSNDSFSKAYEVNNSLDLREEKNENANNESILSHSSSNINKIRNRGFNTIKIKNRQKEYNLINNTNSENNNNFKNVIPKYRNDSSQKVNNSLNNSNQSCHEDINIINNSNFKSDSKVENLGTINLKIDENNEKLIDDRIQSNFAAEKNILIFNHSGNKAIEKLEHKNIEKFNSGIKTFFDYSPRFNNNKNNFFIYLI